MKQEKGLCRWRWRGHFFKYSEQWRHFINLKNHNKTRGTWVAQSVKRLTLDFSSGQDLKVCESKPCVRLCVDSSDYVSPCLSALPLLFLSLSQNK